MIDALPATDEYVDRYDDTSAVILQDYALAPSQDAAVDGEPTAFLIERLAGDGYGSPRSIVDAAKYDPRRDDFWVGDAKTRHLVTPLYAATHPADRDGVEASGNRAATFTYEDDEHAGPLYYFTPAIRPPGPYRQQRHVNAVVDIAADGSFAGVELIDNMPPLAPPASALKGGE